MFDETMKQNKGIMDAYATMSQSPINTPADWNDYEVKKLPAVMFGIRSHNDQETDNASSDQSGGTE